MATLVEIAEAVKDRLNEPDAFGVLIDAVRAWDVSYTLEELETLRVTVMPRSRMGEPSSRRSQNNAHRVQVGVQKRVNPIPEDCDPLSDLTEAIADSFLADPFFDALPEIRCVAADVEPVADARALQADRVFFSIITLTFREERAR